MRALRIAAACAAALIVAAPASAHTDAVRQLSLAWPANGTVTRGFGHDPVMGDAHPGVDIGTLRSLDVHAATAGVVEKVGYQSGFDGYGQIVLVDVGEGYETLYAHLSQATVKAGDVVEAGQKLGVAGSTGYSTGTHVHLELRENGEAVDPELLLPPEGPAALVTATILPL